MTGLAIAKRPIAEGRTSSGNPVAAIQLYEGLTKPALTDFGARL
jgi:hypothetical protein